MVITLFLKVFFENLINNFQKQIPASFALTALTFADYTLKIFFVECSPPYTARLLLAAAAISKLENILKQKNNVYLEVFF